MHMWTHTQHDYKCKQQHLLLTPGWETSNMYYCISRVILLQWPWQAILSVLCFLLLSILPRWQSVQHLVKSFPLSSPRSPSLSPVLPHTSTPHPFSLPVWVTPAWVSLWSWDGFFLLTRASPDNTVQPDTNIIKNEELLVRVAANADMKWKVRERRDGCLTVQRERLKTSQWGPVRSAEGPVARSYADASQTGVFFYLSPSSFSLYFQASSPFLHRVKNS